jgi:hypothetical protein
MLGGMPRLLLVAAVAATALTGCASKSPAAPAAGGQSTAPVSSSPPARPTFSIPPQPTPSIDPCKLTAAQISAVVKFSVTRKATNNPGQCEYLHDPGGSVWFSVDTSDVVDLRRDKGDETFSLGGRYITIVDETGFAHEAFTAVKNPGDKSPGVIADAVVYLHPGRLKLRIYYPQGGRMPGRANALTLAHKMVG